MAAASLHSYREKGKLSGTKIGDQTKRFWREMLLTMIIDWTDCFSKSINDKIKKLKNTFILLDQCIAVIYVVAALESLYFVDTDLNL